MGISNEPFETIENFIDDQGITFPVLRDVANVYSSYNIPGGQSPFPRDFILDEDGIVQFAKTEYDPAGMLQVLENLLDIDTSIENPVIPERFELLPPFPNPFNPTITIPFQMLESNNSAKISSLQILDLNGRLVKTLVNKKIPSGNHTVDWNGSNYPSGIYFVRLTQGNKSQIKKIILLR